jgi:MFS family permease
MQKKNNGASSHLLMATLIYSLSALFFVYEFFIQISPAVMTQELMRDLNIGAGGLGVLSAVYYYAYTPMQLPAGLLFDRFGPKKLLTFACFICALGALAFGLSHTLVAASAGRFLMGIGSAFAFTGTLLLAARWFPSHYFAILAGILQLLSSVGALIGSEPLARAVDSFGWRHSILFMAFFGFGIMLLIAWLVKDSPEKETVTAGSIDTKNEWKQLKAVFYKPQAWIIAVFAFTSWAPILVIAGLWGVPFLMTKYHISNAQAAAATAMIWWGVALGSPLVGWFSEKIQRRKLPLVLCAAIGIVTAMIILYSQNLPVWMLYTLLVGFGFASGSQTLTFAIVKDNNPASVVGTAMGFNNMMVVAGGAILQPLVGYLLHEFWHGEMLNGIPVYTILDYQWSLCIVPLCSLLGLICSLFWIKETYCEVLYPQVRL